MARSFHPLPELLFAYKQMTEHQWRGSRDW